MVEVIRYYVGVGSVEVWVLGVWMFLLGFVFVWVWGIGLFYVVSFIFIFR